ncbi:adenylate/guanylate cyclase domain-containing protein [Allocoleopsis franciscana]|uniref:Family 3 adenylate cyclase n=1 Tax=Allocoleopsis franciscana PCC 7113 TaxID=1173027 RepID=K9WGN8_9CYAN|nr:adenylate/guanylate cyclase domain-containing protein [Allocoleopsis franciscana]AFZ19368.1 family 3 adenylate cyclase [Allocoleopsis franciscana PCC 7113]
MPNESDEFDELLENLRPNFRCLKPLKEQLVDSSDPYPNGGEKEVSILFVNLYGVERLTVQMEVETRVELFNHYCGVMVEPIFNHRGTLDKYIDSTIMAVFNSPLPLENHALMAIKAALAMRDRLPEINSSWFPEEHHPLRIGIGINTDRVFCGNVGSPQGMEFTAVGHGVNVANHLSQQGQQYGCDILIGQKTYESCAEYVQVRERDSTQLKPEGNPFKVYELIGLNA